MEHDTIMEHENENIVIIAKCCGRTLRFFARRCMPEPTRGDIVRGMCSCMHFLAVAGNISPACGRLSGKNSELLFCAGRNALPSLKFGNSSEPEPKLSHRKDSCHRFHLKRFSEETPIRK